MPELPEVETTRLGIEPRVVGRHVVNVLVRERRLRWPIARHFEIELKGQKVLRVGRRAKYLLLEMDAGTLIVHLGMSGSLRVTESSEPLQSHEHVDLILDDGQMLRYRDPRRFGSMIWTTDPPNSHVLLRDLGPEPLGNEFSGTQLYERARGRSLAVKSFIMDARVVVGVGNIYASESLFLAGIHPSRPAGRISKRRYEDLAMHIRRVLNIAIEAGGTTLREYYNADGGRGRYGDRKLVYGRDREPCPTCNEPIRQKRIGQRSSFFCIRCQR